jgi:hypothetical protein
VSTRPVWSTWCNARGGCGRWIGQEDTESQSRAVARHAGWQIGVLYNGDDFCAEHKDEPAPGWSACHGALLAPDGGCAYCRAYNSVMPDQKPEERDIPDMPSFSPPGKLS